MSSENTCDRVDDLIGFLYSELNEIEARRFERHLSECVACNAELASFGQVRESIVEWRDHTLGLSPVAKIEPAVATALTQPRQPAKSAIAAVREFFALSPLWMKGATAFASVLFCVCAVLALTYLKARPVVAVPPNSRDSSGYTDAQVKEAIKQAVEKTRAEIAAQATQQEAQGTNDRRSQERIVKNTSLSSRPVEAIARRPFTRKERQELAADLRLVTKDDDDLDLTIDSNRPTP